jgi:sugar phosphate isomerase/epimerase
MLASELGAVSPDALMKTKEERIKRTFDIASYFGVKMIRIFVGDSQADVEATSKWMAMIDERSLAADITPVVEITHGSALFQPTVASRLLGLHKRWRLLYDPAQLVMKRAQDPFVKYWTLLKSRVAAIDVHDYKIGHGHKPVGYGDGKLALTLADAASWFGGWYLFEPALGRSYGKAMTKVQTFRLALEALEAL